MRNDGVHNTPPPNFDNNRIHVLYRIHVLFQDAYRLLEPAASHSRDNLATPARKPLAPKPLDK